MTSLPTRSDRLRVLIIHGAVDPSASAADLDTLLQVRSVADTLVSLGCDVDTLQIGLDLDLHAREIAARAPDLVFNLVEQIDGRDSLLPLAAYLLDATGVPYTGAPAAALAVTTNKIAAKRIMRAAGIPTPDWFEASSLSLSSFRAPTSSSDLYIVKSVSEHASFGLTDAAVVPGRAVMDRLRHSAATYGGAWFAERYVQGREVNVSLLGDGERVRMLPLAEIEFFNFPAGTPLILDHAAKWDTGSRAYRDTRRRFLDPHDDAELISRIDTIADRCWRIFGLRGFARVDFRIDSQGSPWVLEINANPCLSRNAGFAAAAEEAGILYSDLIRSIVRDAGGELPHLTRLAHG